MTRPPPRVKVCCIQSVAEARMAVSHGADALGLVSKMPSGPGPIPEGRIREIAAAVPPGVSTFLLTARTEPGPIVDQQRATGASTLQLVDRTSSGVRREIGRALPGVRIVQVVHVTGPESVEDALEAQAGSDALLLDSGRPDAEVRELGGTGRTHDWELSRRIREAVDLPVFLAGGLRPANVAEAIRSVRPYGVDVCSGLRVGGKLVESELEDFMEAARAAVA